MNRIQTRTYGWAAMWMEKGLNARGITLKRAGLHKHITHDVQGVSLEVSATSRELTINSFDSTEIGHSRDPTHSTLCSNCFFKFMTQSPGLLLNN